MEIRRGKAGSPGLDHTPDMDGSLEKMPKEKEKVR